MPQRSILLAAAAALLTGPAPARAADVPQTELDALALFAMAPTLCGLDTEEAWKNAMAATSQRYNVPVPTLIIQVRKSMNELRGGLARDKSLRDADCAAVKQMM